MDSPVAHRTRRRAATLAGPIPLANTPLAPPPYAPAAPVGNDGDVPDAAVAVSNTEGSDPTASEAVPQPPSPMSDLSSSRDDVPRAADLDASRRGPTVPDPRILADEYGRERSLDVRPPSGHVLPVVNVRNDDSGWDFVPQRRRTPSPIQDLGRQDRAVRFENTNRYAMLPVIEPRDEIMARAEEGLTQGQRETIARRYERVRTPRPSDTSDSEMSDHRPKPDKGKGPDPSNWGDARLPEDEMDPEVQHALLDGFRAVPHRAPEAPPQSGPSRHEDRLRSGTPRVPIGGIQISTPRPGLAQPIDQMPPGSVLAHLRQRERASLEPSHLARDQGFTSFGHRDPSPFRREEPPRRHRYDDYDDRDRRDMPPPRAPPRQAPAPGGPPGGDNDGDDGYNPRPDPFDGRGRGRFREPLPRRRTPPPSRSPRHRPYDYYVERMRGEPDRHHYTFNDDYYEPAPYGRGKPLIAPTAPKTYDGSADLGKYQRFRTEANTYLKRGRVHPSEQVEVIAPYLDKKAHDFYLQRAAANPSAWEYSDFMDSLFNHCFDKNFIANLRREIDGFVQKTQTVTAYAHEMETKMNTVGIVDERDRVHRLWNGLDPRIESQLWSRDLHPALNTWDEILRAAEGAEQSIKVVDRMKQNHSNYRRDQPIGSSHQTSNNSRSSGGSQSRDRNGNSNSQSGNGYRGNSNQASGSGNGNGSRSQGSSSNGNGRGQSQAPSGSNNQTYRGNGQSGSNNASSSRPSGFSLTDAEVQAHKEKGQCFKCHGFGHMYRNCPRNNVVRSNTPGKPPGMAMFNLEMGYVDEDDEILEDLPVASMHFGPSGWETRIRDSVRPSRPVRADRFNPDWMLYDPEIPARNHIGDTYAMTAEYVLNVSQPYPGDPAPIIRANGVTSRFAVHRINDSNYAIWDRYLETAVVVESERLRHPTFKVARYYARMRALTLRDPTVIGPYAMPMGDSTCSIVSFLLRDGIPSHYPSFHRQTDAESRFDVRPLSTDNDTFAIYDEDQGVYTVIDGAHLRNPCFNLVRWYQLVVNGLRGLDKDSHPIDGWFAPDERAEDSDEDDEPSEDDSGDEDDDSSSSRRSPSSATSLPSDSTHSNEPGMPGLQSVSNSSSDSDSDSSESSTDDAPDESTPIDGPDDPMPSDDLRRVSDYTEPLTNPLGNVARWVLARGAPYPNDPVTRHVPVAERFEVFPVHDGDECTYQIFDHLRFETSLVPANELRNPSFNLGLWYAHTCAMDPDVLDIEGVLVNWQALHPPEWTMMNRFLEKDIERVLFHGQPFDGDIEQQPPYPIRRFVVQRDPVSIHHLLVMDKLRGRVLSLPIDELESPGFDLYTWYNLEVEQWRLRSMMVEDLTFTGPSSLFHRERSPAEAYEQVASNPRAWDRCNAHLRAELRRNRELRERNRRANEAPIVLQYLDDVVEVFGIQVPQNTYPAVQRNAALLRDPQIPKPVVVVCKINGEPSRALIDSGSLGDFISSSLASGKAEKGNGD